MLNIILLLVALGMGILAVICISLEAKLRKETAENKCYKIKVRDMEAIIETYMQSQKTDLEKYLEEQYRVAQSKGDKMIYAQLFSILEGAGITTFDQLKATDLGTLDSIRGIGPKSIEIISRMKGEVA